MATYSIDLDGWDISGSFTMELSDLEIDVVRRFVDELDTYGNPDALRITIQLLANEDSQMQRL